jgi:hypothetical protein
MVDGRKGKYNVIKMVLGASFYPQISHFIYPPILSINFYREPPPPFQMERNHHQRPKRMMKKKRALKEKFLCRTRPPIQK